MQVDQNLELKIDERIIKSTRIFLRHIVYLCYFKLAYSFIIKKAFVCIIRKTISIEIVDRDQYQRNESFLVRLGEPTLIRENEDFDESRMSLIYFYYQ